MKKLALIVILFSCGLSYSQEESLSSFVKADESESASSQWNFAEARKVIKSNPFDFFSAIPTIAADFEAGGFAADHISLQGGIGFIPDFLQPFSGQYGENLLDFMNGYRLRFEPKFRIFPSKRHYLSSEFSFRHLFIRDEVRVGMEPNGDPWNPTYAYFIDQDMKFHRFNYRMTVKYGWDLQLENGMVFDLFAGISLRYNTVVSNSEVPDGGEPQGRWNALEWTLEDGHRFFYPIPVFGVNIGYAIKK
ncbi:MAG: hypothetical protein MI810_18785 [Flavobacteriales bacterium]|jgi:hypothetical protein|nr:hypothetical protein [Flavobacteriales bacterium]